MDEPPRAILVTFPRALFYEVTPRQFLRQFTALNRGDRWWSCKIAAIPKHEVLYAYIVIGNRIRYRANIAGFERGGALTFDDGRTATARAWMVLTAPVVKAPYRIPCRGFRGFHYCPVLF